MNKTIETLKARRSYYKIDDKIKVTKKEIVDFIEEATRLVPDAVDMKSQRVVVALEDKHKDLWDNIFEVFGGKVKREKIDSFKAGYGTVLFFYDEKVLEKMRKEYSDYAENFTGWALQANGMLQINIWKGLREMGLGASLQHYNPVIDDMVKEMFDIPKDYVLLAQMVFGNILEEPEDKEVEDISKRVKIY